MLRIWPHDRLIIHCDVNGHFAYSTLIYHPALREKPVVIGGNEESRHGIVLSKTQKAKEFHIQTGSSLHQARRLCPHLITLPPEYELYRRTSDDFFAFMDQYTDITAPFGCDGISIEVTGSAHLFGGVESLVNDIHERFPREYGLELSIGISWNFVYAKLACDTAGPDGIKWIIRECPEDTAWQREVYDLPVEELLYVGGATKRKLWERGRRTIGDLVACGPAALKDWFGKSGLVMYTYASGQDTTPLTGEDGGPPMRSIGNGSTTPYDMLEEKQVHVMLHVLAPSVCARMRRHRVMPRTVEVALTYSVNGDLEYSSFQCPMPTPSNIDVEFAAVAQALFFRRFNCRHPIRKLTVRGKELLFNTDIYQTTLEMNAVKREKAMKLMACKDEVNERWKNILRRCVELSDPQLTGLGSKLNQQFAPSGWY